MLAELWSGNQTDASLFRVIVDEDYADRENVSVPLQSFAIKSKCGFRLFIGMKAYSYSPITFRLGIGIGQSAWESEKLGRILIATVSTKSCGITRQWQLDFFS